jgi:hypothetical protein
MSSIDFGIIRRFPQPFIRQSCVVSGAENLVLGVDLNAISAYSLGIAAMLLLVLLSFYKQIISFVVWALTNPVQEGDPVLTETQILGPNSIAVLVLPRTIGRTCC